MKKITFIVCLLMASISLAQVLEDFDGVAPTLGAANGAPMPTIVADPGPGAAKGNVLQIETTAGGAPWQQAELTFQNGFLDLTTLDKRVSVDWYSINPIGALIRVDDPVSGAASAAQAAHPGGGWQTLVFDFGVPQDGLGVATGVYRKIFFFNNWGVGGWSCGVGNCTAKTTYVDIIRKGVLPSTTWTGNGDTNTNWNTAANWTNGVPTAGLAAIIPNLTNDPIAGGAITVLGMTIEAGASVTVDGAVTNTEPITVASGASFIAKTSVSGTVTYNRSLNSTNWYSIASPVIGQDVDDFVLASGLQTGGNDVSFCTFDTNANYWEFYQGGTNTTDVLNPGQGYIVNLAAASGVISFSGSMNVGNVTVPLAITGQGYNLLGNPYPSYLDSNAMLTGSSGSLLSQTIWVWDETTDTYDTKVAADNFQVAPGQGFFVQSNGAVGNVTITEAFQSHQATDTFLRSAERTEVYLSLSDGASTKTCKVYYIDGTTTGFDNGFDGPMFRAFPEPLSIYTHLVTNNFGRDIGIQSLPTNDYETLVIPVGINAAFGTELTIAASALNLPDGLVIYLEDRLANTFTVLNANSDFTFTPTEALDGSGRFYLHTSSRSLGDNDKVLAYDLQIYTTGASKELVIKGQLSGVTKAELFDVHGKLVLSSELQQSSITNSLDISSFSTGVYVVKIENGSQFKTQKVIIK